MKYPCWFGFYTLVVILFLFVWCCELSHGAASKSGKRTHSRSFYEANPRLASMSSHQFNTHQHTPRTDVLGAAIHDATFQNLERQWLHALGGLGAAVEDAKEFIRRYSQPRKSKEYDYEYSRETMKEVIAMAQPPHKYLRKLQYNKDEDEDEICSGWGFQINKTIEEQRCGIDPLNRVCNASITCPFLNSPLDNCDVNKVICKGSDIEFIFTAECSLSLISCNGGEVVDASTQTNMTGCITKQVQCGHHIYDFSSTDDPTYCTPSPTTNETNNFTSPSSSLITSNCTNNCTITKVEPVCICSMDRVGTNCEMYRPYTCSYTLLSPEKKCDESKEPLLDGDLACFTDLSYYSDATFQYSINCTFTNDTGIAESSSYPEKFQYYGQRGEEFAISEKRANSTLFQLQMKCFNFNRFSDMAGTFISNITGAQLVGRENVGIYISFHDIPDRFYAGNRLYCEVGLPPNTQTSGSRQIWDKQFIDLPDVHIHRHINTELSANTITWIIVACVVGCCLLLICIYWGKAKVTSWKERRRTKRIQKED